jgi:serine/threonine protein kinase/class 3 adenylate cyclase
VPDESTHEFTPAPPPERRRVSVTFADLRDFVAMSEAFTPQEVQETIDAFLEETIRAVEVHNGVPDGHAGTSVTALFGAHRPSRDHAWKAIRAACDQFAFLRARREDFHAQGKLLPECSIAVHTGDMVLGHTTVGVQRNFAAFGPALALAERLTLAARPGEVLTTGATLTAALADLPGNWQVAEATAESPEIPPPVDAQPLPADLRGRVILVGPNVTASPEMATFRFRYRHVLPRRGTEPPLAVLAVDRPDQAGAHPYADIHNLALSSQDRIVGRYHLLEVVGRGGMAEVWRARDNSGHPVAIKILRGGVDASEQSLRRLKREAEIMQRLSHRNVCAIREIGFHDGITFIAMEYIEGPTLSAVLSSVGASSQADPLAGLSPDLPSVVARAARRQPSTAPTADESATVARPRPSSAPGTLPVQQSLSILIQICAAIHYAHGHGILHRDLKPGNILMRPNGEPVVTDFGLGKIRDAVDDRSLSFDEQVIGTIDYMAPEQARASREADERADVWSLGAILYQMLSGHRPFVSSGSLFTDLQRLPTHEPAPLRTVAPHLDPDLETIAQKALRNDPAARYRNAGALGEDLARFQRGEAILARPTIAQFVRRGPAKITGTRP